MTSIEGLVRIVNPVGPLPENPIEYLKFASVGLGFLIVGGGALSVEILGASLG